MPRVSYVNGRYVPHRQAVVHVEDRGYQFADGVYEVVIIHQGRLIDQDRHLDRLERSLRELAIPMPMARASMQVVFSQMVRRNLVKNGILYLQVTRGVAPRNHAFPANIKPVFVVTIRQLPEFDKDSVLRGVKVITAPDIRWKRCDIKTVSLLPNAMLKQKAVEAGAFETWMIDDAGFVTEGTASNVWIVTKAGEILTRSTGPEILSGITRIAVLEIAQKHGLTYREQSFTREDALAADEAFITSASSFVKPVTHIDNEMVGNGRAGKLSTSLLQWYVDYMENEPPND